MLCPNVGFLKDLHLCEALQRWLQGPPDSSLARKEQPILTGFDDQDRSPECWTFELPNSVTPERFVQFLDPFLLLDQQKEKGYVTSINGNIIEN